LRTPVLAGYQEPGGAEIWISDDFNDEIHDLDEIVEVGLPVEEDPEP
jgi:hypothetical protein